MISNNNSIRYSKYLIKCVESKDEPPKQKHIRIIIMNTYQDQSLDGLMLSLSDLVIPENGVSYWKLYFILHSVIRDGLYDLLNLPLIASYLVANKLKMSYGDFYTIHSVYYNDYIRNKISFHQKNINIKGNLTIKKNYQICPYNDAFDVAAYLHNCITYYDTTICTLELFLNALSDGKNISILPSGQNKLFPIVLLLEDCIGIFRIIPKIFQHITKLDTFSRDSVLKYGENFSLLFFMMRKYLNVASSFSFIQNLVDIPKLNDVSPIEAILAEVSRQNKTKKGASSSKTTAIKPQETPIVEPLINPTIKTNENPHKQCQSTIQSLQNAVIALESQLNELKYNLEYVKNAAMEKYKTDMDFATKKLSLLTNENKLLQSEIDEHIKLDKQNIDSKFNRLKELYAELRNEYNKTRIKLTTFESEKKDLLLKNEEKDNKMLELKNKIQRLNMDLTKYEAIIATSENEIDNLKLQKSKNSDELTSELEQTKQSLEIIQNKYHIEKTDLMNRISHLQKTTTNNNLLNVLCDGIHKHFGNVIKDMSNIDSTNKNNDIIHCIEKLSSIIEHITQNTNIDKDTLLTIIVNDLNVAMNELVMCTNNYLANISDSNISDQIIKQLNDLINKYLLLISNLLNNDSNENSCHALFHQLKSNINMLKDYTKTVPQNSLQIDSNNTPQEQIYATQHYIQEAKLLLTSLINESNLKHNNQINVNPQIVENCTLLLNCVEELVQNANILQIEIVDKNNHTTKNTNDFYKKNHRWSEGLTSAAKAVGASCNNLVQTADRTISNIAPFEELIVAALDISACTAQLISASKVKADPTSDKLFNLINSAKSIKNSTDNLINTVTNTIKSNNIEQKLDLSTLSVTQTKRLELSIQIKCLELERNLENERAKLLQIRSKNFHAPASSIENNGFK